ncbi:Organic hydroperoxide resistance transcriptional regulator [Austwickia sp. TVS 96-490-7B]|nr:Organic hydroperoxide resistance transcriptional regulator [Austwickia sp. TVS 96-490-7B]
MPPALDDQLCFALYAASRATTQAYRPGLARLGLTYPQFITLLALCQHDGLGVAELAQRLHLDASTLSPLLKRMETMGLVERRRSTRDERRVTIHLTAAGRDLAGSAAQVRQEVAQRFDLTAEEAEQMRILALRLIHTLEPDDAG